MSQDLFRDDNTTGYTVAELDVLNTEWRERGVDPDADDYDLLSKAFCDEVAKR